MNNLENQLKAIIQKTSNYSQLKYQINIMFQKPTNTDQFRDQDFSFKEINIICSKIPFKSFTVINDEIKEICYEITKLDNTHLVRFIFEQCDVEFLDENINLDEHISFIECNINVNVQDKTLETIYLVYKNFHNCIFKNLSLLRDIKIIHIDLISTVIELLQLVKTEVSDNKVNKIEIKNSQINKILIQDAVFHRDFTIYETIINTITIKNIDFMALSEFNEVTFQNEFDFKEITYKGLTLFDRCIFNTKAEFEYIIFEKFTSFRGSIFNKGLNLDFTSCDKEINFFGIKGLESNESRQNTSQETYRIIKYNFEKIGNEIEANNYQTIELEKHRHDIWNRHDISMKLLLDGMVSVLHWISSNHSSNWLLALFWIFMVSLCTNVFLEHAISIEHMFKYINILSKIGDFNNSYMVMILNKVSLGYLYYQFLTAVRKDTRK